MWCVRGAGSLLSFPATLRGFPLDNLVLQNSLTAIAHAFAIAILSRALVRRTCYSHVAESPYVVSLVLPATEESADIDASKHPNPDTYMLRCAEFPLAIGNRKYSLN